MPNRRNRSTTSSGSRADRQLPYLDRSLTEQDVVPICVPLGGTFLWAADDGSIVKTWEHDTVPNVRLKRKT